MTSNIVRHCQRGCSLSFLIETKYNPEIGFYSYVMSRIVSLHNVFTFNSGRDEKRHSEFVWISRTVSLVYMCPKKRSLSKKPHNVTERSKSKETTPVNREGPIVSPTVRLYYVLLHQKLLTETVMNS